MKNRITSIFAGVVMTALVGTLSVSALAASGSLTLNVDPIKVLVNGAVFEPKDSNGSDALVFTYNGTTYAPLRALAEAYGLEVGYDSTLKAATVNLPSAVMAKTQTPTGTNGSFESQWAVVEKPVSDYGSEKIYTITYSGSLSMTDFKAWWLSMDEASIEANAERMAKNTQRLVPGYSVTAYFSYGNYPLGTAYAFGDYEQSNFNLAKVWVK